MTGVSLEARLLPAALALVSLGSCAGIFQRPMPERAERHVARASGREILVGAAEADITPATPQYLAGFSLARKSTGTADSLKARAIVFVIGDLRVAVVGIDNLGVMRGDADWIKSGIEGFAAGNVFLCASHTHSAPDLVGIWGFYFLSTGRDRSYVSQLRASIARAVASALRAAAPARLVLGKALLPPSGLVRNSNRPFVFDRRITVVRAEALDDGRPLGTLLHLACHPEVLGRTNTLISSDFVGALCEEWRSRGLGQAVFVNGALGAMVTPDIRDRDAMGAQTMGRALADLAETALGAGRAFGANEIEVRRRDVYVPLRSAGLSLGRLTSVLGRDLYGGCARSSVGFLRIGEFEAVAVPGEMEPVLAERLRRRLGLPGLVVFGLCDDEIGYLMRETDARDPLFAYERSMSPCARAGELVAGALVGEAPR
ncbi:MAG: hypothetical protein Fur0037_14390 [Planctomycetota bacterium]